MTRKQFNNSVLVLVLIWLVYILYEGNNYDKEIKEFGVFTIGKVTNLKGASKRPGIDYSFNVSGKKVFSDSPVSINSIKEGEFYKVVYSSKNPEVCRIYLDEKITDTALILKAGFSREDIANMPN
jgi:hypothetical protein